MSFFDLPVWFFIVTGVPIILMTCLFVKVVIKTWNLCTLEEMGEDIEDKSQKGKMAA
ncbi:hypothetical protein Q5427_11015 [Brochothrix thermosphacta]|uniref:hypothetical protein n=1 Tax=Brochothrix thermosphacta TaxID=2756 RepID=UPI002712F33B|nr:hypothetical protein [Brochothrix thermosphacta]MDO7864819.1 hypothetical protein [Brochothrix thermosphacta]